MISPSPASASSAFWVMKPGPCTGAASSTVGDTVQHVRARLPHPRRPHRRSARLAARRHGRSHQASDAYEAVMARLNLPTEADLDALTRQIAKVERRGIRPIGTLTKLCRQSPCRGGTEFAEYPPVFSAPSASLRCFRTRTATGSRLWTNKITQDYAN